MFMEHHMGIASTSGNSQSLGAKILLYLCFGNVAGSEMSTTIAQPCEFMHSVDENHVNEVSEDNNLWQQLIFIGSFNILCNCEQAAASFAFHSLCIHSFCASVSSQTALS